MIITKRSQLVWMAKRLQKLPPEKGWVDFVNRWTVLN